MADRSAPAELTTLAASSNRPLLSALSRWWAPTGATPAVDPELGYESAHPWTLGEDAATERGSSTY